MVSPTLRNWFLFVLLSLAAAGTWLLGRPQQVPTEPTRDRPAAPLGYYLRNAVIMGTDTNGIVTYRIFAARVEQATDQDDLVLTDVRVEYEAREDIPWLVTAEGAAARNGGEQLDLYGGVRLATRPDDDADATVIETQELHFVPEMYLARALVPVSVSRGGRRLRSSSMSADLKSDRIDLEGVHGQFDH